jgi:MFS family permease
MFRALKHTNFRRFLGAQACAMTGHWVQQVALGWLIYRLTDSAFYLALAGTFSLLPSLLLTPFVGVLADKADRRRMLLATQSAALVHSLLLATLVLTGATSIPLLLGLALFQGVIQGFDWTNRQSLLAQLVDDRADLPNAIALNSTSFNLARILGPSLAGALLVVSGEAACLSATRSQRSAARLAASFSNSGSGAAALGLNRASRAFLASCWAVRRSVKPVCFRSLMRRASMSLIVYGCAGTQSGGLQRSPARR